MTLLFFPTFGCNMSCLYCFQRPNLKRPQYSIIEFKKDKVEKALELIQQSYCSAYNQKFDEIVFHGGEATIVPLDLLEEEFSFFKSKGLKIGMQSNCFAVTDKHVELFKKYNVTVGCSVDGFPDINTLRGFFDEGKEDTKASEFYRKKVLENIERLQKEKILTGVIILLHKANASDDTKLDRLVEFIKWLKSIGVTGGRINHMYPTYPLAEKYALTNDELFHALVRLYHATKELDVRYSPFDDVQRALTGEKNIICWFSGCSYYDALVWSITADGKIFRCDRALGNELPSPKPLPHTDLFYSQARAIALIQTELKDDKYAHLHRGGCPAEAIGGDWRRPSAFIKAYSKFFEYMEQEIKKVMPNVKLASEYPDKIRYIQMIDSGRKYNMWRGDFD
jgi:sulfatase maturation enzyme AslB (radical SAM superfamily)